MAMIRRMFTDKYTKLRQEDWQKVKQYAEDYKLGKITASAIGMKVGLTYKRVNKLMVENGYERPKKKPKDPTKKVNHDTGNILGSPNVSGLNLPSHAVDCVKRYGNTVISNKLYKKAGILGLQKLFANAGIRVLVSFTPSGNCIVSKANDEME